MPTHDSCPLDGVLVVAVEQAVAAPFATRQLADLGARVIKIERPDGGDFARGYDSAVHGMSSYFLWLNRSKESVALDLKSDDGRAVLDELIARADVFVQNIAPGAARRLGFDAQTLVEQHPRLVAVDVSGYGAGGPQESKRAYDLLVQSETALVSVTGTAETPTKTGIPTADIAAGMYAMSSVLAALLQRERTGRGTAIDVSLFDATVEWMSHPLYLGHYTQTEPPRRPLGHTVVAPYDKYPTADGTDVVIGIQNDREWQRFAGQVLRLPELADDPRFARNVDRVANRGQVDELVTAWTKQYPAAEVVRVLDGAGIANGRLNGVRELAGHEQLVARGRWREVGSPVGPVQAVAPPFGLAGFEARMDPIPALGEHTAQVLAELGYDAASIKRLT